MFDIGQTIFESLQPLGTEGLLLVVFTLFFIDAIVFPTLPELFAVIIFMAQPTAWFALMILAMIAAAELLGTSTLYFVIKKIHVPKRIQKVADRYCSMLFVKNEKIVLLNRIAPVLPFMGAFAAICNWNFRKVLAYTFVGGMIKYGAILAMATFFFVYMSSGLAENVTIGLVIGVIVISLIFSVLKNRKEGRAHESG